MGRTKKKPSAHPDSYRERMAFLIVFQTTKSYDSAPAGLNTFPLIVK